MRKTDLRQEFIGKEVKVADGNIEGRIIDETKNSFLIKTKGNLKKRLLKQNSSFQFKSGNDEFFVDGNLILMRPEDRIKIKTWKQKI